eukprot:CAMPEP_0172170832 /NCGR_PEP_ID=MMETSP1050-20130122/11528_1 /TAXON_ID=233186 /ORGANISM="Cryptomonas curvata, Strain CCAP979/52" /LENGTH=175 /DNA_ID=CAMNT_0012842141 /DNA_START=2713 /DNA_END=3237 /DNA_ORIENTATION=-
MSCQVDFQRLSKAMEMWIQCHMKTCSLGAKLYHVFLRNRLSTVSGSFNRWIIFMRSRAGVHTCLQLSTSARSKQVAQNCFTLWQNVVTEMQSRVMYACDLPNLRILIQSWGKWTDMSPLLKPPDIPNANEFFDETIISNCLIFCDENFTDQQNMSSDVKTKQLADKIHDRTAGKW